MWVFTYGSLMYDGWEEKFGCLCRERAQLQDFRRDFNKASRKFWGTNKVECPTLGLRPEVGSSCQGIAFGFPDNGDLSEKVLLYLGEREGRSFSLRQQRIHLSSDDFVQAVVPINEYAVDLYAKEVYIGDKSLEERARMASIASGVSGRCAKYVENFRAKLLALGIDDPYVEEFWKAVRSASVSQ
ncbi:MAG: gamma-glutamylcyclotransferase [Rubrobacteraceae bacterium]|uniref:gamma-glutamylcyclotransferase n=1 Tax=Rubrobacter naiadicus TaxID=1392641 RepID=UPI002361A59E|nr:gamma-glutamylcyclotransferase [Rubrobacter naiadicus]MBX6765053.1 gamma-glutamylcyclotransferase [Rubrobacteraceae bacterium]